MVSNNTNSIKGMIFNDQLTSKRSPIIIGIPNPAWPFADGALLVSKGGAQPQMLC